MASLVPTMDASRQGGREASVVLLRPRSHETEAIQVGDIRLDQETHLLQCGGREWLLRAKSVAVMAVLMRNAGRVITRESLIAQVWGQGSADHDATLRVYVHQLRQIVDAGEQRRRHIVTIRSSGSGGGYLFRP
jgi:two-component system response regulator RegX3